MPNDRWFRQREMACDQTWKNMVKDNIANLRPLVFDVALCFALMCWKQKFPRINQLMNGFSSLLFVTRNMRAC